MKQHKAMIVALIVICITAVVAENELTMLGLEATPLTDDPRFLQATEAVVLTRVDDYPMQQLLRAVVDKHALLAHQQRVVSGEQEPSY